MMNDLCNSQQFTTVGDLETTAGSTFPILPYFTVRYCEYRIIPNGGQIEISPASGVGSTVSMPGLEANFPLRWYWDHQNAPPIRCSSHTSTSSWYGMWYVSGTQRDSTFEQPKFEQPKGDTDVWVWCVCCCCCSSSSSFCSCCCQCCFRSVWIGKCAKGHSQVFKLGLVIVLWICCILLKHVNFFCLDSTYFNGQLSRIYIYIYSTTQNLPEQVSFHLGHSLAVSFVDAILLVCFEIFITWTSKKLWASKLTVG